MKLSEITKLTVKRVKTEKDTKLSTIKNFSVSELKLLNNNKDMIKKGSYLNLPVEEKELKQKFQELAKNKKNLQKMHQMKLFADEKFYLRGENTGFLDWQYDILKEFLEEIDPNYKPPVGAKIREGENRANLPFWLGSMDKYKPENAKEIYNWISKHKSTQYVIEDKLDGISCLLQYKNGSLKIFTRGDGTVGANISALAPYFSTLPKKVKEDVNIRGELIMKKSVFTKKYSKEYANARNLVAGRIGAKTIRKGIEDIDFVAYEIVGDGVMDDHVEQMKKLKKMGFLVVNRKIVKKLSVEILSRNLVEFKKESPYEIDGIIIQPVQNYERNVDGNPDYAFAFKMRLDGTIVETEVIKVIWNISKWGQIKPKIKIKQISLGGVKIDHATGFNAKYISDNKIGPGAVIKITRSGDVIPHIVEVVKKSKKAQMPDIPYEWNKTGVDIIATNSEGQICIKLIESFFSKMGTKHLKEATVKKMYAAGLDTVLKIISADKSDFLKIDGIEEKGATRLIQNIKKSLKDASIPKVLGASQIFGFGVGEKRLKALFQDFPDILSQTKVSKKKLLEKVRNVEGFDTMAENIVQNIKSANEFIKKMQEIGVVFKIKTRESDKLKGKKIVFSGFRDKELQEKIEQNGGKVTTSVSKNTSYVVVKTLSGKISGKIKKANELGIKIILKSNLIKML